MRRGFFLDVVVAFVVAFLAGVAVTFVWSKISQGAGAVNWTTTVIFAIVFAIVFPWFGRRRVGRREG